MAQNRSSWEKVITIYSPGSGTGKSEIAASLAYLMAVKGKKVWLIDANLFSPSLDIVYDMTVDNCETLNEFLLNNELSQIPVCNISHVVKSNSGGKLYLTPCIRNDTDKRFKIERALIEDESICEQIPDAIYRGLGDEIDYLLVDTHPGFERINQVWLGITNYLVMLSRITDVDIENLGVHLKESKILDIKKILIVFNNVCLNEQRNALKTMNNDQLKARFFKLILNPAIITGQSNPDPPSIEIFQHPIPYSQGLAVHQNSKGLYIQRHKTSNFAQIIKSLSEKILKDLEVN